MYVTTPYERLMLIPCSFTNIAAATGTYTTTAVKYDLREKGLHCFAPMR